MQRQIGRKALIVLSDGVDFGSETSLGDCVDAAQKSDTLIDSIRFSDPGAYGILGGGQDGRRVLERMCDDSGGSFFEVSKKASLDAIYGILEEELRNQYSIGYVSDKPATVSEFRAIQLQAKEKGLEARARKRYWAHRCRRPRETPSAYRRCRG